MTEAAQKNTVSDMRQRMNVPVILTKASRAHLKQGYSLWNYLVIDDKCQAKGALKAGQFKAKVHSSPDIRDMVIEQLEELYGIEVSFKTRYSKDNKEYYTLTQK